MTCVTNRVWFGGLDSGGLTRMPDVVLSNPTVLAMGKGHHLLFCVAPLIRYRCQSFWMFFGQFIDILSLDSV